MYLLRGIGDVVKDNPRVVKFILNSSICRLPLRPSLGSAEADVSVDLLLLNVGDTREDVAVAVCICGVDVPDPLINVEERSQWLVPLSRHPILGSGVQVRMRLRVPKIV